MCTQVGLCLQMAITAYSYCVARAPPLQNSTLYKSVGTVTPDQVSYANVDLYIAKCVSCLHCLLPDTAPRDHPP